MTIAIDTQKAYNAFIKAEQAQALVEFEIQRDHTHLATKADIVRLDNKIDNLEERINGQFKTLEAKLTAKIYGGQIAAVVSVIGALKLFGLF